MNIQELNDKIQACEACKLNDEAINAGPVPGWGQSDVSLLIVAEAPGAKEDKEGVPLIGESGKILHDTLIEVGVENHILEQHTYKTNVVKCRPPNNRDPEESEVSACRQWLTQEIDILKPTVILALGKFARDWFQSQDACKQVSDKPLVLEYEFNSTKYIVVCSHHPIYTRYKPASRDRFLADVEFAASEANLIFSAADDDLEAIIKELQDGESYEEQFGE